MKWMSSTVTSFCATCAPARRTPKDDCLPSHTNISVAQSSKKTPPVFNDRRDKGLAWSSVFSDGDDDEEITMATAIGLPLVHTSSPASSPPAVALMTMTTTTNDHDDAGRSRTTTTTKRVPVQVPLPSEADSLDAGGSPLPPLPSSAALLGLTATDATQDDFLRKLAGAERRHGQRAAEQRAAREVDRAKWDRDLCGLCAMAGPHTNTLPLLTHHHGERDEEASSALHARGRPRSSAASSPPPRRHRDRARSVSPQKRGAHRAAGGGAPRSHSKPRSPGPSYHPAHAEREPPRGQHQQHQHRIQRGEF